MRVPQPPRISRSAAAFVAALLLLQAQAAGQTADRWFEVFASDRGAPPKTMKLKLRMGPFPEPICYAAGAIALDGLNRKYLDKDFMGRCDGGALLTLPEISARALSLLPEENVK